ncbi:MAG: patatin-like phospholipase family protein [Candidatus Thiodiazotropha sp.]
MATNSNGRSEEIERTPAIFEQVLDTELMHFGIRNAHRPYTGAACSDGSHECDSSYTAGIVNEAHEARLSGLAFSGGGIRSATFNLGVLQALAKLDLLKEFDYLSTVSGGGYIGSWLSAWIWHEQRILNECSEQSPDEPIAKDAETKGDATKCGLHKVSDQLAAAAGTGETITSRGALQPDPPAIWHLREYSNYLTPQRGLWSKDTWTLALGYIRNLVLTLGVLLGAVITLVLLGQAYAAGYRELAKSVFNQESILTSPYYVFILLIGTSSLLLGIELSPRRSQGVLRSNLAYSAVILTLFSAIAGTLWLWSWPLTVSLSEKVVPATLGLLIATIVFGLVGRWFGNHGLFGDDPPNQGEKEWQVIIWQVAGALLGLIVMVGFWYAISTAKDRLSPDDWHLQIVVIGVPLLVLSYSIAAAISIGFSGSEMREVEREWMGRFFGVLAKFTILYMALMALIVYSYIPTLEALNFDLQVISDKVKAAMTGLWAAISFLGAFIAKRESNAKTVRGASFRQVLINIASGVFIIGLLVLIVWLTHFVMQWLISYLSTAKVEPDSVLGWLKRLYFFTQLQSTKSSWVLMLIDGYWLIALGMGIIMLLITVVWSRRVGVNDFSLHALYGNRLVRAYLGASNLQRNAHPFTGFDQSDNALHMADLEHNTGRGHDSAPYLIINSAINLVSSHRLAWQKRKAASFTFTPLFCGYEFCEEDGGNNPKRNKRTGGYVPSKHYGGSRRGVSIGKAMTISGAAASPNMGYYSTPALSFLMTTFNVRLGWWLPNTAKTDSRLLKVRGPRMGLLYLITEALGLTGAQEDYVYLSDGGHFENLGIYELVRRRCRYIIASDVEADPNLEFKGLGNAIEKCRTDLGVPIDIDVSHIKRDADSGLSRWHCAIGCIRYSNADPGQQDGTLLYIKASLTGDEPMDVAAYARANQSFPHQSTVDQWFDETQFESYRALGEHCTLRSLKTAVDNSRHRKLSNELLLERIFLELRKQWYASAVQSKGGRAENEKHMEDLIERLRNDDRLAFLDSQLYPNLQRVINQISDKRHSHGFRTHKNDSDPHLPENAKELRAGFYFCKELIQFMQQVFHEQQLDTEYASSINRGWMNLFRRWSYSSMLHFTWTMTAGTYSARFQSFCEYHLGLDSGEPKFGDPIYLQATVQGSVDQPNVTIELAEDDPQYKNCIHYERVLDSAGIHRYERYLLQEFINSYVYLDKVDTCRDRVRFEVLPLKINVDQLCAKIDPDEIDLNAGFVIIGPHPDDPHNEQAVIYFRIRSSMRNMDLARKAFLNINMLLAKKDTTRLPSTKRVCLDRKLPKVEYIPEKPDNARKRQAYNEIHNRDRDYLGRCHWFSQLLQDTAPGKHCGKHRRRDDSDESKGD